MSQNFSFSQQGTGYSPQEEGEYKYPDMIIVEEGQESSSQQQEGDQRQHRAFRANQRIRSPRLLSFLGFIFSLLFGVLVLLGSLPSLFFAALFLFRNRPLNLMVKRLWKLATNALVVSAGFLLGVLSPRLGFGFVLLYLSWHAGHDRFSETIRRFFSAS